MRWSLPLRVRPQISKSSLTFTHDLLLIPHILEILHSSPPIQAQCYHPSSHNYILSPHESLNRSTSTYLKTAFILIFPKYGLLYSKCKFILYTWNEYNMSTMLIKEESLFCLSTQCITLKHIYHHFLSWTINSSKLDTNCSRHRLPIPMPSLPYRTLLCPLLSKF